MARPAKPVEPGSNPGGAARKSSMPAQVRSSLSSRLQTRGDSRASLEPESRRFSEDVESRELPSIVDGLRVIAERLLGVRVLDTKPNGRSCVPEEVHVVPIGLVQDPLLDVV